MSFTDISSETRNSDYNNITIGRATLLALSSSGEAVLSIDSDTALLYLSAISISGGKPVCFAYQGSYFIPESYEDGKLSCSLVRIVSA